MLCSFVSVAQVPEQIKGNWIDKSTGEWAFGFFDGFAIADADFWNYESVDAQGATLRNGGKTIRLTFKQDGEGLKISRDGARAHKFERGMPKYRTADNTPFPAADFQKGEAILRGVFHGIKDVPPILGLWGVRDLKVGIYDFVAGTQADFHTTIDSLGRFEIKIPLAGAQEAWFDWSRTMMQIVLQPGNEQMIFVEVADLLPQNNESREQNMARLKNILFMGTGARINNEMVNYRGLTLPKDLYVDREQGLKGMEYLNRRVEHYNAEKSNLEHYTASLSEPSERVKFYLSEALRYSLACDLMQQRFYTPRLLKDRLPEEFMAYIDENFRFDDTRLYTLLRSFNNFCRDYVGYAGNKGEARRVSIPLEKIVAEMERKGTLDPKLRQLVDEILLLQDYHKENPEAPVDSIRGRELDEQFSAFEEVISSVVDDIFDSEFFDQEVHLVDSMLAAYPALHEIALTQAYFNRFDYNRKPLPQPEMAAFDARITSPAFRDRLLELSDYYAALQNKPLDGVNIVNNDAFEDIDDPEELLAALIAPYRGKVVYADFWGTWCGPCRENMKLMPPIKAACVDKDVVFLYFANNSPEATWRSLIGEMNLTGHNVVHHRLPGAQQKMLEEHLGVHQWPTYILFDRNGNIINADAPAPRNGAKAVSQAIDAALLNQE